MRAVMADACISVLLFSILSICFWHISHLLPEIQAHREADTHTRPPPKTIDSTSEKTRAEARLLSHWDPPPIPSPSLRRRMRCAWLSHAAACWHASGKDCIPLRRISTCRRHSLNELTSPPQRSLPCTAQYYLT